MPLLLGIDLGTSYFKVGLFECDGTLKGLGRVRVDKDSPQVGWLELPVDRFWALLRQALGDALREAGAKSTDIAGVSYSSQANTFLLLDRSGAPLTPLVFWNDRRAARVPASWAAFSRTETFCRAVGFEGISVESAVTKWRWYREHEPVLWSRARWHLTIADYLTYALTGEMAGDASTAALLGLYHLPDRRWWSDALAAFEIDARMLATPLPPGSAGGRTGGWATVRLGLPAGIPFAVGALDHHAAAVGAGLNRFAEASISTGTVLAAVSAVDRVEPLAGCYHGPHLDGARYFRLAFHPDGAGKLDRFQRQFAPGRSIEALIAEAAVLAPGARPDAEAWTPAWGADRARAVRALMEEIAWAHRTLLDAVGGGCPPGRISATGGGARSPAWLAIMADIVGRPILVPAGPERACLGAAIFAAAAAGLYANTADAAQGMVRAEREFVPDAARHRAYQRDQR
jgi:sugar (pentulose or hexulose) kinase